MDPFTWAAAASIGSGIAGFFGGERQNAANRQMAREQMSFQERMSSTAAQRSVEDYRKAGLNPGLAYDRGASSPSGAATTIGDSVSQGINSAQSARAAVQQLRIAKEQHDETIRNTRANTVKTLTEAQNQVAQGDLLKQQFTFNALNQPVDLRMRTSAALLNELLQPGARNQAKWDELLGIAGPGLSSAGQVLKLFPKPAPTIIRNFRR